MKKILILGGGYSQIQLAQASKGEGYYVIICDPNVNCRAREYADKFYQTQLVEKEYIKQIAIEEKIDGVISNSEPIMHVVSFISEELGLVGNSTESISKLISKSKFRNLQDKCGVFCPRHISVSSREELLDRINSLSFPVIIKPSESSGSRGTKRIDQFDKDTILEAFEICRQFTRDGMVEIEGFVPMPSRVVCEGDIFVWNDSILWDGLFFTVHSKHNTNIPVTDVFPFEVPEDRLKVIKDSFYKLFKEAGIRHGQYNVEMYFDDNDNLFIIEINVRQGGNGIPDVIKLHSGVDLSRLLVTTTVGDESYWNELKTYKRSCRYICRHLVFPNSKGNYQGLEVSDEIKPYLVDAEEIVKKGDMLDSMHNASDVIAFLNFDFTSKEIQLKYSERLEDLVKPIII